MSDEKDHSKSDDKNARDKQALMDLAIRREQAQWIRDKLKESMQEKQYIPLINQLINRMYKKITSGRGSVIPGDSHETADPFSDFLVVFLMRLGMKVAAIRTC